MRSTVANGLIAPGQLLEATRTPRIPIARNPALYMASGATNGTGIEIVGSGLPTVRTRIRGLLRQGFSFAAPSAPLSFGTAGLASGPGAAGQMDAAIAHHRASLLGTAGPVVLAGTSMGTENALVYALEHPGDVACIVLWLPIFDLVDGYENNVGGLQSAIATAWGVTAPAALPAEADTLGRAGELDVPILAYYASDDIWSVNAAAFAAASGATVVDVGALGHTDAVVGASIEADIIDFVQAAVT